MKGNVISGAQGGGGFYLMGSVISACKEANNGCWILMSPLIFLMLMDGSEECCVLMVDASWPEGG